MIKNDLISKWKVVFTGVRLFVRHTARESPVPVRLSQEGLSVSSLYMPEYVSCYCSSSSPRHKRCVYATLDDMHQILSNVQTGPSNGYPIEKLSERLRADHARLTLGSCILTFDTSILSQQEQAKALELGIKDKLMLVAWRGGRTISLFVSKFEIDVIREWFGVSVASAPDTAAPVTADDDNEMAE